MQKTTNPQIYNSARAKDARMITIGLRIGTRNKKTKSVYSTIKSKVNQSMKFMGFLKHSLARVFSVSS